LLSRRNLLGSNSVSAIMQRLYAFVRWTSRFGLSVAVRAVATDDRNEEQ
jgi:hypothetical protein